METSWYFLLYIAISNFKIDLIVWKQEKLSDDSESYLNFKIDLIVWKHMLNEEIKKLDVTTLK